MQLTDAKSQIAILEGQLDEARVQRCVDELVSAASSPGLVTVSRLAGQKTQFLTDMAKATTNSSCPGTRTMPRKKKILPAARGFRGVAFVQCQLATFSLSEDLACSVWLTARNF